MNSAAEQDVAVSPAPPAYVREVVCSAGQQLAGLVHQKAEIMRRIGTIKKMLAGMANLFGNEILDDDLLLALERGTRSRGKGFTPACRQVLMESRTPLHTRDACAEMQRRFPDLAGHHKDLNASVTTVFHRLVKYGQARCFVDDHGTRLWEWATDREVQMADMAFLPPVGPGTRDYL